jgi:hypothetical protein
MQLTFTDSIERTYVLPEGNLRATPGETYELECDPGDGRWAAGAQTVSSLPSAPASSEDPLEASVSHADEDSDLTTEKDD